MNWKHFFCNWFLLASDRSCLQPVWADLAYFCDLGRHMQFKLVATLLIDETTVPISLGWKLLRCSPSRLIWKSALTIETLGLVREWTFDYSTKKIRRDSFIPRSRRNSMRIRHIYKFCFDRLCTGKKDLRP